ncbi:MAG TPA: RraA family protein [Alphaproteobacteria bacterium]
MHDIAPLSDATRQALISLDTPSICNALEIVAPERRTKGFTARPLVAPFPQLKPVLAYARTVIIRSKEPDGLANDKAKARRIAYYEYVEKGPRPSIMVMQDIDGDDRGFGCFWGEVQSNVHKGLGCVGVVTDGAVRDIDMMAPGFFVLAGSVVPSHAWVHAVDFGVQVNVTGMVVNSGDLIHADRHGAVVIPHGLERQVVDAASLIAKREAVIIAAARQPGFTVEALKRAMGQADDIH